ncbi:MAG: HDOD domain-containing protein [Thermodesulfovibrionales bacterium]|nr:HDOD domain-containing protein [Thermodesulfovibrionales bacterium]
MTSKEIILKSIELPAVPMVAGRVIELIDNPNTSLEDLQKTITADPAMTTRILKIANSSFYGLRQNVDTISEAIAILGLKVTRLIVLAAATRGIYKRFGKVEQKLWEHSLGVSIAAGVIGSQVKHIKREEAVVAGLLHDVGKVLINNSMPDKFVEIINQVDQMNLPSVKIEQDVLSFNHSEVGYYLAQKWGFPEILCDVILNHHNVEFFNSFTDPYLSYLCSTIAIADALCVKLGVGYLRPMPEINLSLPKWLSMIDMSESTLDDLINVFKQQFVIEKMAYQE